MYEYTCSEFVCFYSMLNITHRILFWTYKGTYRIGWFAFRSVQQPINKYYLHTLVHCELSGTINQFIIHPANTIPTFILNHNVYLIYLMNKRISVGIKTKNIPAERKNLLSHRIMHPTGVGYKTHHTSIKNTFLLIHGKPGYTRVTMRQHTHTQEHRNTHTCISPNRNCWAWISYRIYNFRFILCLTWLWDNKFGTPYIWKRMRMSDIGRWIMTKFP